MRDDINLDLAYLIDDLLDVEVEKSVEGGYLLRDEAMLRKVAPDDRPGVVLVDVVVWKAVVAHVALEFGAQIVSRVHLDI